MRKVPSQNELFVQIQELDALLMPNRKLPRTASNFLTNNNKPTMLTKETLETFMTEFGFKPFYTKAEIKELPSLFHPEEKLLGLLEGILEKIHNRKNNFWGLAIVTNRRIIFFRKSIIGTVTKEETPISKVSSASYRKGLLNASIAIATSNNESEITHCDKANAKKFIDIVQNLISELDKPSTPIATPQPVSSFSQIEKLFEMKEKGMLTQDEFNNEKAKLLA